MIKLFIFSVEKMLCNHCNVLKTEEEFYKTKSKICKQCLKTKIKCDICEGYYSINNKSYHMINFHSQKQTCKICQTDQYLVTNATCRNCNNAFRREKTKCPNCNKVLAKSSLTKHKKICKNPCQQSC